MTNYKSSGNSRIKVCIRIRPLFPSEKLIDNTDSSINVNGQNILVKYQGKYHEKDKECAKLFTFDNIFPESTSQEEFFIGCGIKSLLNQCIQGYSVCLLAYGQTGSGKTYTISGNEEKILHKVFDKDSMGLMPQSIEYILNIISDMDYANSQMNITIRASYYEIYNEQVFDLLNPTTPLQVRHHPSQSFFIQNLLSVECQNIDDIRCVIVQGHNNRHVGSHQLNRDSSRSHCILVLNINTVSIDPNDGSEIIRQGKISFVDLAGSERLKDTKSSGSMLKETGNINRSLFTLGNIIRELSTKNDITKVNYRNSTLTKVLLDSLGGNSLTLFIACITPCSKFIEYTLSTLNYATCASHIQNKPVIMMNQKDLLIQNLKNEVAFLKQEVDYYKQCSPNACVPYIRTGSAPNNNNNNLKSPLTGPVVADMHNQLLGLHQSNEQLVIQYETLQKRFSLLMIENQKMQKDIELLQDIFCQDENTNQISSFFSSSSNKHTSNPSDPYYPPSSAPSSFSNNPYDVTSSIPPYNNTLSSLTQNPDFPPRCPTQPTYTQLSPSNQSHLNSIHNTNKITFHDYINPKPSDKDKPNTTTTSTPIEIENKDQQEGNITVHKNIKDLLGL